MTICIAAICDGNVIVTASDRMLTAMGIEYEPGESAKVMTLTDTAYLMIAGSMNVHGDLILGLWDELQKEPGKVRRISEFAAIYSSKYWEYFSKRQEQAVLTPRHLTHVGYQLQQNTMHESVVQKIDEELNAFSLPEEDGVAAIFAGKDDAGAHIYVFKDGRTSNHDAVGYAAIGVGDWLALSQFMFAKHSRNTPAPKAAYTLYKAKKMAEAAGGVGKEATDLNVIVEKTGPMHDDLTKLLKRLYERDLAAQEKRFAKAEKIIREDLEGRMKAASAAADTSAGPALPSPSGGGSVPSDLATTGGGQTTGSSATTFKPPHAA